METARNRMDEIYAAKRQAMLETLDSMIESVGDLRAPSDDFHPHWGHIGDLASILEDAEALKTRVGRLVY